MFKLPDMDRRWNNVDPILLAGDGTALFAIECRKLNDIPAGATDLRLIDAVDVYRRSVTTYVQTAYGAEATTRHAAHYRRAWRGCSFSDVVRYVAGVNGGDADG